MCYVSRVRCHMSHITCQMSLVTCQMLYFSSQSGEVSLLRVCFNRVYPVQFLGVSYQKRVDTQYLPACSGPFLVIKKTIDENLISERLEQVRSATNGKFYNKIFRKFNFFKNHIFFFLSFFNFYFFKFFYSNICTVSQKCTEIVLVKLSGQLFWFYCL